MWSAFAAGNAGMEADGSSFFEFAGNLNFPCTEDER